MKTYSRGVRGILGSPPAGEIARTIDHVSINAACIVFIAMVRTMPAAKGQ